MSRKALFFDIDGTLVDNDTKIAPKSAIEALKKAKQKGNLVIINTGRTKSIVKGIRNTFDVDGISCGCGTQIIINGETIFEHRLPLERCNEIKKVLLENNVEGVLEAQEAVYFSKAPFRSYIIDRIYQALEKENVSFTDTFTDTKHIFDKACIHIEPDVHDKDKIFAAMPELNPMDRGAGFFECIPRGFDKGRAVQIILDKYNISPDDAYVFGDSINDLAMFKCGAKNKIVMGVHDKILEQYATLITKDVNEDGIAYALDKLELV